jgi:hypothetical protein
MTVGISNIREICADEVEWVRRSTCTLIWRDDTWGMRLSLFHATFFGTALAFGSIHGG